MKFKKYSEIENSYRNKEVENIKNALEYFNAKDDFVVLEKVDGTNFQFIYNNENDEIKCATRNRILNNGDKFFCWEKIYDKYKEKVKELANEFKNAKSIHLFGEMFGGKYGNLQKGVLIQKRVDYLPENDFILFDIFIDYGNKAEFLDYDIFCYYANKYSFKRVPELFRGKFLECLRYPNEFVTKVPNLYGLETIEDNIAEGVIIKYTNENIRTKTNKRLILKNKNEKFSEKMKKKGKKYKNQKVELTKKEIEIFNELIKYLTENRILSVLSKGDVQKDWKDFGKIVSLLIEDAIKDYQKDKEVKVEKKVRKEIGREAQILVRKYLKENI